MTFFANPKHKQTNLECAWQYNGTKFTMNQI